MTEIDTNRERLERLQSIGCADYLHMALLGRAEAAESERDTAWNDAIEAAADEVTNWHSCDGECVRSLKKGDPT